MAPHHILLMVQSLGHGGCERDAAKIAMGLDRSRYQVHVGVLRAGGFRVPEVLAAGIPVADFGLNSLMDRSLLLASRAMKAYIREHEIKLIQCFDTPTDIFGAPNARWSRVPSLLTSQLSYRELCSPRDRALLRISDRLSDRVVVNSKAVGESLIQEAGVPREKIYLCYNGVDTKTFYPAPVPRPEPLRDASVIVGSVCVMRPEKRIDWILQSFAEVIKVDSNARLLLVGSGPEVVPLQQLSTQLGIAGSCLFVPGQADVSDWLRSIDVYINSSRSESFPNALLEAMACGCCVIGSEVGGIPELVTQMEDGLTFPVNDHPALTRALMLAVTNGVLRQDLRERAARRAKNHFAMQHTLDRMDLIYSQLLKEKSA